MYIRASQVVLVLKNMPANAGDFRDMGSIPGLRRFSGGGHSNPLQYSYLENPMDRGAWQATVPRVAVSWTLLKRLSMFSWIHIYVWLSPFAVQLKLSIALFVNQAILQYKIKSLIIWPCLVSEL